jgi:ATP-dependent RNA helicase DeaD
MANFEGLGLREELLRTLEDEDVTTPTALQQAVIPALRRGGNVVARASSGSGKTLAYLLGILDRIEARGEEGEEEEETTLRVLVLTPTAAEAERVALASIPYAQASGLVVAVPGGGWGTSLADAHILVAAAGDVMGSVRSSSVKLDDVEAVVIDGAGMIVDLGDWEQVDSLLDLLPRDAQRVVVSPAFPPLVEDLIDRRVKRALRFPPEAAVRDERDVAPVEGTVAYVLASEREKLDLLSSQLGGREANSPPPIIFCRSDERAATLAEQLALRGFFVGQADEEEADVAIAAGGALLAELVEDLDGDAGQTISYDVPADVDTLRGRHQGDGDAVILVEPRELAHLREIARLAHLRARPTAMHRSLPGSEAALATFREQIRAAIQHEDLTAQMLVLEPLFEEFSAAEVAAAAAALLRSRRPSTGAAPAAGAGAGVGAGAGAGSSQPVTPAATPRQPPERSAPTGPAPATWARLFVSIGSKEDIRPGDLVGAIAGEANIPGSRIGKIEIRDAFSIVEIQADFADQVIRAMNGTTMKGRSLRVDYDRGGPGKRPPTRGGAPPRRSVRRPPS